MTLQNVFLHLLNMSITAGWLVLAVVVLRLVFRRAPKWIHCLLWVLVALRLLFPVSIESALSIIPSAETVPVDTFMYDTPVINSGVPLVDNAVNPVLSDNFAPQPENSANPMQVLTGLATYAWVLGAALMLLYAAISTIRLRLRVRESVRLRDNIYRCDRIWTPFILGILRPRIYLPTTLSDADTYSVVAHEMAHIQRRDHWWKPLGFLLLTVYWFNPLLWVGYVLLCRDIEAACDERVIRDMDLTQRKSYSDTLLACSAPRHLITACPLAFGETGVKSRIKSVLSYKKPAFWLIIAAVVATVVAAVCLLTNPAPAVSDELDAYLTHVIVDQNYSREHTDDVYPTEAHTVFGTAKKDGKTVVYGMVLYEEYYLDENGELQVQNGSHIPTVITLDLEGNGYSLVEYWIPRDGTYYPADIREKYPIRYWLQTDTQRHIDKHQQKTLADAKKHFGLDGGKDSSTSENIALGSRAFGVPLWNDFSAVFGNVSYSEENLPVRAIHSLEEFQEFISDYNAAVEVPTSSADTMLDLYKSPVFDRNIVVAVYYKDGSSSVTPDVVGMHSVAGSGKATLFVDVYSPYMQNDAVGSWIMLTTIDREYAENITAYSAQVRASIPADYYIASFEKNRYMYQLQSSYAREEWRARLGDEAWDMEKLVLSLGWESHGHKAQYSPYIGAVNVAGETYYVNNKYDMLSTKEKTAYLTADQSKFVRSLFTKSRNNKVGPVPYSDGDDPYKNEDPSYKEYTYLYGRYMEHNKAERYVILQVVHAENADLVGKKVVVSLEELSGFGMPSKGAMIEIPYDGKVEKLDGFPMVKAKGFDISDGAAFVNFNDPGDIYDDEVGGKFKGKVIQVTKHDMLMECYDKDLFNTVWVNYTHYYPEMKPEVGDEYQISFCDGIRETYPPQVTGEVIKAISYATERENNFISEKKAIEIAANYWKEQLGDKDPNEGYVIVHIEPTFENPFYSMTLRELIVLEDGTTQFNPRDGIRINAVTGEIALPGGDQE